MKTQYTRNGQKFYIIELVDARTGPEEAYLAPSGHIVKHRPDIPAQFENIGHIKDHEIEATEDGYRIYDF